MSKCIFCTNEKDGPICKHCLAKGATKANKAVKSGKVVVTTVLSVAATITILKGKKRS